jgi:hypothetical protein
MKTKLTATEQFEDYYKVKFLKSPKGRTTAENLVAWCLYEFTNWRDISFPKSHSITREAACIETVLIMEGLLEYGQKFEPKVTKSKFLFWEVEQTETYHELLRRMGLEYLKEKGVVE